MMVKYLVLSILNILELISRKIQHTKTYPCEFVVITQAEGRHSIVTVDKELHEQTL